MLASTRYIKEEVESRLSKDLHQKITLVIDESRESSMAHAELRIVQRLMDNLTAISVIKSGLKKVLKDMFIGENEEARKFVTVNGVEYITAFIKKSSTTAILKSCYEVDK